MSFFLFTAFWNIFNYLSLQEKFIVFFAPLAIYFFQKSYKDFRWQHVIWIVSLIILGLMSKATFIFIPLIFTAYALLDILFVHNRPKLSWVYVIVNGIIFSLYAVFTFTMQLKGSYTEKYKSNLNLMSILERMTQLPMVMKWMLIIGLVGFLGVVIYTIKKNNKIFSLAVLIY